MSVYIEGVGTKKIDYKNQSEIEFNDLSEYMLMAKKSISKFANRFYNGLAKIMLKDEDAISNVAYCIMMGDWRYDKEYNNNGQNKTQYSYRNQCALWAIQSYVTKNYKRNKSQPQKIFSLDHNFNGKDDKANAYSFISDVSSSDPIENLIKEEERYENQEIVDRILADSLITEKQKEYIRLYYYSGKTYDQIGKIHNLTREAIRQSIKKAIAKIREENANV